MGPGLKTRGIVGPGLKTGWVVGPKNLTDGGMHSTGLEVLSRHHHTLGPVGRTRSKTISTAHQKPNPIRLLSGCNRK